VPGGTTTVGLIVNGTSYTTSLQGILDGVYVSSLGLVALWDTPTASKVNGTTNICDGQWWRIEWDRQGTTSTVRIYLGTSATPTETLTSSTHDRHGAPGHRLRHRPLLQRHQQLLLPVR
jgi:hypothetical protein